MQRTPNPSLDSRLLQILVLFLCAHSLCCCLRPVRRAPLWNSAAAPPPHTHHNTHWHLARYVQVALSVTHVPFGCGVWPAFWSLGTGVQWPHGGELDILEALGEDRSKVSWHSSQSCVLGQPARYLDQNYMNYECSTDYFHKPPKMGCAPTATHAMRTAAQWSSSPGAQPQKRRTCAKRALTG